MAKLTNVEKVTYSTNKRVAKEKDITFVQSLDKYVTVAVMSHDRMGNFVRVYVSYCSLKDTPKKKRGINAVMQRYWNDNYILLPTYGEAKEDMAFLFLEVTYPH